VLGYLPLEDTTLATDPIRSGLIMTFTEGLFSFIPLSRQREREREREKGEEKERDKMEREERKSILSVLSLN